MSMEKGVTKYWTPKQEELWARRLKNCRTFAQQHLTMSLRDLLKFDERTKEGKRAVAQGRLRLTVATDRDLEELVVLPHPCSFGGWLAPGHKQHFSTDDIDAILQLYENVVVYY
ncbi:unnamed protein product [marine sediment metagenome]|uniref:Uncharacterized protein n=1 Tax=marine sediment metagenome TaxID=412755 RepID=X1QPY9_9ZZZZ